MKLSFAALVSVAGLFSGCGGTTSEGNDAGQGGAGNGGTSTGGTSTGGTSTGGTSTGGFAGLAGGGGSGGCGSGTGGGSAVGGSGGGCTPDPTQGSEIQGNLIVYDAKLSTKQPFLGQANILMEGTPCGWAIANYDGSLSPPQNFLLQGVAPKAASWMRVDQNGATQDVMTTLLSVYTVQDLTLMDQFAFVRASEIEALYQAAGVSRDPQKGTVLIQVVDVLGTTITPTPGAEVTSAAAAAIVYASPSGWAKGGPTDATGVAALLNTEACAFPGTLVELDVKKGALESTFAAVVEGGGVTIQFVTLGF